MSLSDRELLSLDIAALGLPTLLSPRMSVGDPRARHHGLSHHTRSVLELLLAGVTVPRVAAARA